MIHFIPVQLTLLMIGGLGLAVSVVTSFTSDREPSLLAVKPRTDILYCVAGSEAVIIITLSDYYFSNLLRYPILAEVMPASDSVLVSTHDSAVLSISFSA